MKDLTARAAVKLSVKPDELYTVVIREAEGWPPLVVVLFSDYRKVTFPLAELPELPVVVETPAVKESKPIPKARKQTGL